MSRHAHSPEPTGAGRTWRSKNLPALVVCVFAVLLAGIAYHAFKVDQATSGIWGCEMSYMWPSYRLLAWPESPSTKYRVYLYRESGWDHDQPSGHPVLFLPGNAGSYQQVRSIASSATRQVWAEPGKRHAHLRTAVSLDVFAGESCSLRHFGPPTTDHVADFNEDFSAFHAQTLREQADYVAKAVRRVLAEYDHLPLNRRPRTVTLLGHSMGGVVARLASEKLDEGFIDMILTMSTPHLMAPATIEYDMDQIYSEINSRVLSPTTPGLISICGGVSDTQIVSDYCRVPRSLEQAGAGYTVFTTGMPGVWTPVEHQAIVWCHQVRWRVARALLDMSSQRSRSAKLASASRWLGSNAPHSRSTDISETPLTWRTLPVKGSSTTLIIRLSNASPDLSDPVYQILGCTNEDDCTQLQYDVEAIPLPSNSSAPFPLKGEGIQPSDIAFVVTVGHGQSLTTLRIATVGPMSLVIGQTVRIGLSRSLQHLPSDATAVHGDISGSRPSALMAHRVVGKVHGCSTQPPMLRACDTTLGGQPNECRFFPVTPDEPLVIHSHSSNAPFRPSASIPSHWALTIFQTPDCPVTEISVQIDVLASIAKIIIRYRSAALAWTTAWTFLVISHHLSSRTHKDTGYDLWHSIGQICEVAAPRIAIMMTAATLSHSIRMVHDVAPAILLGNSDWRVFWIAPVLAIATLGWTCLSILLLQMCISAASRVFTGATSGLTEKQKGSWQLLLVGFGILVMAFFLPRELSVVALLLTQALMTIVSPAAEGKRTINLMVLLLLGVTLPFNAPALVVWGRNVWAGHPFASDHNVLALLPALAMVVPIRYRDPSEWKDWTIRLCTRLLRLSAAIVLIFGARWTWVIPLLCHVIFLSVACMLCA